ncbi:response regulator [Mucilaginibacter phyllosphaerae]|uniref:CheY-like chemotaxis protein n=1 Tax=Mucilaginibacter phyllosphaerae TaxID=1812349 RepID=A0A4Y8ABK2_9SPHI|nr:response regulator [Mucilaginibacter phyllosphaerae]MBB3969911.1 CheY-like chemotaxis protein [Mucilaginibacter phyllosphaerae]TEW65285.1 response regulator [Mucilaginibacter phyllosphaerae]GGH16846.1 hypothetical protein GCM10007352_26520 [Mucilaginibacter phyllosphaerae]
MKLEYNILWIDNDIQEYIANGEVNNLNLYLEELGFEPNIVTVEDEADLDNFIYNYKYDLIISDFNLNATTGDKIIEKIRDEKGFSTEILFYTAKSNFRDDPDVKERLAFMDRITFHSNRDTFLDKVEKLIRLTLDKLLELNATRGLITAATSDLDVEIEDIVMLLVEKHGKTDDALKQIITDKAFTPLQRRIDSFWDNYNSFQNYFHKIDAVKKWEVFRDLLRPLRTDPIISAFLTTNRTYQDDVIKIRNQFAHAKAIDDGGLIKLKGQIEGQDFEYTEQTCITVRKNLINHKRSFEGLKQALA